jgi:3-phenylpropionate/cinnamic acid dioxygenase small subunit
MSSWRSVDAETERRVAQFLAYETSLLDNRRLTDWLDVVTDDFMYKIPTTSTPEDPTQSPWDEKFLIVDDSRDSIAKLWVVRQTPGSRQYAWGESPPQRIRRFVTNLRVSLTDEKGVYLAESNVLLSFVRASEPVVLLPAGRTDLVREVDGELKLARRVVRIDPTVVPTGHLRLIF